MARVKQLAEYFQPIIGQKPWQAMLGWGSFLTFEFGPKISDNGCLHGSWHLWIYQCEWVLRSHGKQLVHSESNKHAIEVGMKRLEAVPLTKVEFNPKSGESRFVFDHYELLCRPYDDPEFEDELADSEYWMFFLPDHQVVSIGRSHRLACGPSNRREPARVS